MQKIELPEDQALVLQQVSESGEEDLETLAEIMRFDRSRLIHIVQSLHHKGLIYLTKNVYSDPWIRLSSKGRKLMTYMWPETGLSPA